MTQEEVKSNYEEFQSLANMNLLEFIKYIYKILACIGKDSKSFKIIREHKLIGFIEKVGTLLIWQPLQCL